MVKISHNVTVLRTTIIEQHGKVYEWCQPVYSLPYEWCQPVYSLPCSWFKEIALFSCQFLEFFMALYVK